MGSHIKLGKGRTAAQNCAEKEQRVHKGHRPYGVPWCLPVISVVVLNHCSASQVQVQTDRVTCPGLVSGLICISRPVSCASKPLHFARAAEAGQDLTASKAALTAELVYASKITSCYSTAMTTVLVCPPESGRS